MVEQLFSSESVSPGHPDKVADQISDAVLDAILAQDKNARVACECLVKNALVLVAGEINTSAWVDIEQIVRRCVQDIGYNDHTFGFDAGSIAVVNSIGRQSEDIAQGVDRSSVKKQGAGDQGMMFGFASSESSVYMPVAIAFAHRLMQRHAKLLHTRDLPWLGPDAKTQVAIVYEDGHPKYIKNVVLSTQHKEGVSQEELKEAVMDSIIKPILPGKMCTKDTKYYINPTGRFVKGGPVADCGLTGRKIIVDTYGGMSRHGGGCFSGKDPSKVDRSAAYMARYIAKHIVAANIARKCEIQLAYAIGMQEPTSIMVDSFGTSTCGDDKIAKMIKNVFDLTPYGITSQLNLLNIKYLPTATFGHFGRNDAGFSWERLDKLEEVKASGLSLCSPSEFDVVFE